MLKTGAGGGVASYSTALGVSALPLRSMFDLMASLRASAISFVGDTSPLSGVGALESNARLARVGVRVEGGPAPRSLPTGGVLERDRSGELVTDVARLMTGRKMFGQLVAERVIAGRVVAGDGATEIGAGVAAGRMKRAAGGGGAVVPTRGDDCERCRGTARIGGG